QALPDKVVGNAPFVDADELIQPKRKAFDEPAAGEKLLVLVVLVRGKGLDCRPLLSDLLSRPAKNAGQNLLSETVFHCQSYLGASKSAFPVDQSSSLGGTGGRRSRGAILLTQGSSMY